jgi:hypothetical protein
MLGRLSATSDRKRIKESAMSKAQKNNKEARKPSLHTAKEKKAAKQVKKHAADTVPLLVH